MIVFLNITEHGDIIVQARAEGNGGMLGDMQQTVRQGGEFLGHDYDELKRLGEGEHDLSEPTTLTET